MVSKRKINTSVHLSVPLRRWPRSYDEELDRVADLLALAADLARLQGRRRQHDRRQASDGGGRVRPRRARLGTDVGGGQGHDRRGGER